MSSITPNLMLDTAMGFNSGHSTIRNFSQQHDFRGLSTWAGSLWTGFKTACKAHNLSIALVKNPFFAQRNIWIAFGAWAASYTITFPRVQNYVYGCKIYQQNALYQLTPLALFITRIALSCLEYTVSPVRGGVALVTTAVGAVGFGGNNYTLDGLLFNTCLPFAANVTIFVLGDPLSKAVVAIEMLYTLTCKRC